MNLALLLAMSTLFVPVGDGCSFDCTDTTWRLFYQSEVVDGLPDMMTEEECRDILSQLESQTGPFTTMECVSVEVKREES